MVVPTATVEICPFRVCPSAEHTADGARLEIYPTVFQSQPTHPRQNPRN